MAANTGIRVTGLKETLSGIRRAGVDVGDLKEGFTKVGNEVVTEAKAVAPVGRPRKGRTPGGLRDSIRTSRRYNAIIISAGGARAPYAPFVHFGTKYMPARRFIYQALNRVDLEAELQRVIDTALRRAGL